MLVFVSTFQTAFSSSFVNFNPLDHQGGWVSKYSATVVVGVAVATVIWRHAWIRIQGSLEVKTPEEARPNEAPELKCSCGLPAKLRISRTFRNPYRLFYNCPKNSFHHQCEYFHWYDDVSASKERSRKEVNYLRHECIRLHKKIAYVQSQRENERASWEQERSALRSKVTSARAELDDIKRRIQHLYGTDNMPPIDESYISDEEDDGAIVIEAM